LSKSGSERGIVADFGPTEAEPDLDGRLPSFLILGAGRCGTTTLCAVLARHPCIFLATPKEPTFFCRPFNRIADPLTYVELFDAAPTGAAIGEASHAYLTHPEVPRALKAFLPDVRMIVILRNPADRAFSLYKLMRARGFERISSFERALAREERRFRSTWFAKHCSDYFWNFMYYRSGLFGEQIERYFRHFERTQFFILTLAQLQADGPSVVREIHEFLGVEPMDIDGVPRENQIAAPDRRSDAHVLSRIWGVTPDRSAILPALRRERLRLIDGWHRNLTEDIERHVREELMGRYDTDLRKLRTLTGIDLV
jgi:Sulfotransferase domain